MERVYSENATNIKVWSCPVYNCSPMDTRPSLNAISQKHRLPRRHRRKPELHIRCDAMPSTERKANLRAPWKQTTRFDAISWFCECKRFKTVTTWRLGFCHTVRITYGTKHWTGKACLNVKRLCVKQTPPKNEVNSQFFSDVLDHNLRTYVHSLGVPFIHLVDTRFSWNYMK